MLERLDLPIRDLLRFALPGLLVAACVDWGSFLYHHKGTLPLLTLAGIAVVSGMVAFAWDVHRRWPWKKRWDEQTEGIRKQLIAITDQPKYIQDEFGKPMYKIWLDAICTEQVRAHLHYTTGLFYVYTSLSVIGGLATLAFTPALVLLAKGASGYREGYPESLVFWGCLLSVPAAVVITYFFVMQSRRLLNDVMKEGLLAMNLPQSKGQLKELARAAAETRREVRLEDVDRHVRDAVRHRKPREAESIVNVTYEPVDQYDLRTDDVLKVAHITCATADCATAQKINGRENLYNGPLQDRLQSDLERALRSVLPADRVRLQLRGDVALDQCDFGAPERKEIDRVTVEDAIATGRIPADGAVVECCKRFGLAFVLLRSGRVIGPNPDLARVVDQVVSRLPANARVLDPFCGTGLTAKIVEHHDPSRPVDATDVYDWTNGCKDTGHDAFKESHPGNYGLVVVDPLYEDVIPYLKKVVRGLDFQFIVVAAGDESDLEWNRSVQALLDSSCSRVQGIDDKPRFGKRIFAYEHLSRPSRSSAS